MEDTLTAQLDLTPAQEAQFRGLFLEEAAELLRDAEQCLQKSAAGTSDFETAGTLFRCAHSIKSGAAAFGMRRIVKFAHSMETTLDELRRGTFVLDNMRRHMFLRGYDMIATLLKAEFDDTQLPDEIEADLTKTFDGLIGLATTFRADPRNVEDRLQAMLQLRPAANTAVRIELSKIDNIVAATGEIKAMELMLRQQMTALCADVPGADENSKDVFETLDQLSRKISALQNVTSGTRMQPLENVFQRLPRFVRELADSLGKQVNLTVTGGKLEVDKIIIEQLADPLMHLLRNAIDHGIEKMPFRIEAGKPLAGTISLDALRLDKMLKIVVTDDGGGLNLQMLKQKAQALGLITGDEDTALAELVFYPGISTANAISEVSGRGVGLDAVRHSLQARGGDITIGKTTKEGTTFLIILPLHSDECGY